MLDHLHQSRRLGRQPQDGHRRSGGRGPGHHAGRVRRDRDERVRRRGAARHPVGGVRRRHGQLGAEPDPRPGRPRPARAGAARLAADRPRRLRDGFRRSLHVRELRGRLRRAQAGLEPEDRLGPARRDLPAPARDPGPVAGPDGRRQRPQPGPLPQRRRQPDPVGTAGRNPAPAGIPHRHRPRPVLRPAPPAGLRTPRRRLSLRPQHRPPAAPVAHPHQDRQGRQTEQARPRALRRTAPRRRRRHERPGRGPHRGRLPPRPRRPARRRHRPRTARELLRAVPLERPLRGVPRHQRRHQRRRRPGLVPARVQGLRRGPAHGGRPGTEGNPCRTRSRSRGRPHHLLRPDRRHRTAAGRSGAQLPVRIPVRHRRGAARRGTGPA